MDYTHINEQEKKNINDNLLPDIQNNDYNDLNDNFTNQKNEVNNKKEYDVWPEIRVFTYLLFFLHIFYLILLIIYFPLILDEDNVLYCLSFIIISGIMEIFYIYLSLFIFCSENKTYGLEYYGWLVFLDGLLMFGASLLDFLDSKYFTTGCKVIVISGSSLIFLLSFIFLIWSIKLIHCNKHVNVIYIF